MSRRYRAGTTDVVPCACRGWLYANPDKPLEVVAAVREHRATPLHQSWDAERWRAANTARVIVVVKRVE